MHYGLGFGKAIGRTMGCAMAGALTAVSAGRVAGVAASVFALTSLVGIVTSAWHLVASWSSSPLFAEYSKTV